MTKLCALIFYNKNDKLNRVAIPFCKNYLGIDLTSNAVKRIRKIGKIDFEPGMCVLE